MTGALPRHGASAPAYAGAPIQPWTEERIARLVEDATDGVPGATGAAALVRVHRGVARVDLDLVVDHGAHLPTVAEAVRRRLAARVAAETGLTVEAVTVTVVDLRLSAPARPEPGVDAERPGGAVSGGPVAGG
ncbi:Asp23/Gls24 family envelope stress response protein [Micromonospora sp. SL1-18]|uniref:Asp23/Gls24 family envelope stress response protein n=1 Tax=Micromonospora sp. SL1-18 TaxID=3399128 RepID=UPI003A4D4344